MNKIVTHSVKVLTLLWRFLFGSLKKIYDERIFIMLLAIAVAIVYDSPDMRISDCQKMEGTTTIVGHFYKLSPDIECMGLETEQLKINNENELNIVTTESNLRIEKAIIKAKTDIHSVIIHEYSETERVKLNVFKEVLKISAPHMIEKEGKEFYQKIISSISDHKTYADLRDLSKEIDLELENKNN